jgi:hypothetical protein
MKLELYYPLKPHIVNQYFGTNDACIENNSLPISQRRITSKLGNICLPGYIELYPLLGMKGHTGIDLYAFHGQTLYYCGPPGTVQELQTEIERGLGIGIITKNKFDFEGLNCQAKLRFWHLKTITVKLGDEIKVGDIIGYCDSTGLSSGNHLHFELKPVVQNNENGVFTNILQSNGYFGSVNPEMYFNEKYAVYERKVKNSYEKFGTDIRYRENNQEVKKLQLFLNELGYFTYPEITGYYGDYTRQAVRDFQNDYVNNLTWWERFILIGKIVGPKTRLIINSIINK